MDALHARVDDAIRSIPEGQRLLVTGHEAFGAFPDSCGIEASEAISGDFRGGDETDRAVGAFSR